MTIAGAALAHAGHDVGAYGAGEVVTPCLDLASWGTAGKIVGGALALLAVMRPVAQVLLTASQLIGPQAAGAARILYVLGQAAAMVCISKPEFAKRYAPAPTDGTGKPLGG